jgi:hypothetical protein
MSHVEELFHLKSDTLGNILSAATNESPVIWPLGKPLV